MGVIRKQFGGGDVIEGEIVESSEGLVVGQRRNVMNIKNNNLVNRAIDLKENGVNKNFEEKEVDLNKKPIDVYAYKPNGSEVKVDVYAKGDEALPQYEEGGRLYLKNNDRIWALDSDRKVVSPNDLVVMKEVISRSNGLILDILRGLNWDLGCRQELIYWINIKGLKNYFLSAREGLVDKSEEVVYKALCAGDVQVAQFVLKTIGKRRGWNDKENVIGDGEEMVKSRHSEVGMEKDVKSMSLGELTELLEKKIKNR